jgi:hypothetical protein
MSYVGTYVLGMGFTLSPGERDALVKQNHRNAERIFPYLGGKEVNSSPTQDFDRHVISFGQMELEEAARWPDLLAIVREKVKPERDKVRRDAHRKYWWHFADKRPALYTALEGKKRCLVTAIVSKHLLFSFQPADRIYSHKLNVFPLESYAHFAVLQSRVHAPWAWLLSSTMKDDLNYSASDCFETFPFPVASAFAPDGPLEKCGRTLYEARGRLMVERNQGLTATYNQLKDPEVTDAAVEELRRLHADMDRAVVAAYGWDGVEVPPFSAPSTATEWKAKVSFEDEVIDRLFALNAERAAEERALGLETSNAKRSTPPKNSSKKKPAADQLELSTPSAGKGRA